MTEFDDLLKLSDHSVGKRADILFMQFQLHKKQISSPSGFTLTW
jgi:hypothetical protein